MSYLQWLAVFFGIPILIFVLIDSKVFTEYRSIFAKILFAVTFVGLPTDLIAVKLGLWTFPSGLSGISFFFVPIEEYLWAAMYAIITVFITLYFYKKV